MTDPTDLQRRAAALLDPCCKLESVAWIDNAEELIRDLLAALSARDEAIRREQSREPPPEPSALEQRLLEVLGEPGDAIQLSKASARSLLAELRELRNEYESCLERDGSATHVIRDYQQQVVALTQAKADAERARDELSAILTWVEDVLRGGAVHEFAQSMSSVRLALDVMQAKADAEARCAELERERDELLEVVHFEGQEANKYEELYTQAEEASRRPRGSTAGVGRRRRERDQSPSV